MPHRKLLDPKYHPQTLVFVPPCYQIMKKKRLHYKNSARWVQPCRGVAKHHAKNSVHNSLQKGKNIILHQSPKKSFMEGRLNGGWRGRGNMRTFITCWALGEQHWGEKKMGGGGHLFRIPTKKKTERADPTAKNARRLAYGGQVRHYAGPSSQKKSVTQKESL